jgi:radical SAM superfamily enzyme YgiQ (UPF0313 family)
MRVLFVVPPYRTTDVLVAQLYPMPYGPTLLATVLRAKGHEVAIKDFLVPAGASKAKAPACFAGKHAPAYQHFGLPMEQVEVWLRLHVPEYDVICLAMGQCNLWETGQQVARIVRGMGRPLVVGGPYATTAPQEVLALTGANVLVQHEAEGVIEQAILAAQAGAQGQVIDGGHLQAEDFRALPVPAWQQLTPLGNYPKVNGRTRGVLAISRGCPHGCRFCSVHTIMGRRHRRLDHAGIVAQLEALVRAGATYISFLDDNLFISAKETATLLAAIAEVKAAWPTWGSKARFYCEEGIEVRVAAEPGLVRAIVAAGFQDVALGVETMSGARREEQRKPFTEAQLAAAVRECREAKVVPRAFYIVGLPGDTMGSVCRDLVAFGKLGMAARPNNLKLYPGTEMTEDFQARGLRGYDWRLASFYTPELQGGLRCDQIRKLKTVLGAIGTAADQFGLALFDQALDLAAVGQAVAARGFKLIPLPGGLRLEGRMFRPTPYRHLLALLLLKGGAAGAATTVGDGWVEAHATKNPTDEVQIGIAAALRGEEVAVAVPTDIPQQQWVAPVWVHGDSRECCRLAPGTYDMIFTCPPYHDLERYSDNPADLSAVDLAAFLEGYRQIIASACSMLAPDRFAVIVVGEVRGKGGAYENLVGETIRAFLDAGLAYYNEMVLVTAIGTLPLRAGKIFNTGRKIGKTHQNVLVFVKGDPLAATRACGQVEVALALPGAEDAEAVAAGALADQPAQEADMEG